MKSTLKMICIIAGVFMTAPAFANDGFSVGGVGTFGGSATNNPVTENGWPDLDVYRQFRDCCGYENTPTDATLANNALSADNGEPGQAEGSNCAAATYGNLKLACGLSANSCQTKQRSDMSAVNAFNNINPCLAPGYSSYTSYQLANGKGYVLTQQDANLYAQADGADSGLNALCPSGNCSTAEKSVFQNALLAQSAGFTSYDDWVLALDQGYGLNVADATLYAEAQTTTYDAFCPGSDCSTVDKPDFQAAKLLQADASSGTPLSGDTIQTVLNNTSSTLDSDVSLSNPLHLAFVQDCIDTDTSVANIAACTETVDSTDLNQYVVSEIAGGASGTITSDLLEDAGIPAATASVAAGNSCGPDENQSCLTQINSILSADGTFTAAQIETALANYMDGLVTTSATSVPTASTTAGCSTSSTTFNVPNPPSICASVNWNCSSNTTGISVTYTDAGKGNVVADTTSFSGGSYSLTATLNIGGQTRTRTINGTVNINQLSAAAGAGFKTGWQPAWWKHYDVIGRAKNSCANQGGSLATYAEIQSANATYNIIGNGTRTLFRDANGNADKSTSGRAQCSDSWPQGPHSLTWSNSSKAPKCKGSGGFGRNYTYVCKDIPCN